jgi:hypothetical protein
MTSDDIIRLCAEVSHFSKKANLRWKGLPIIAWEFADIGDFHNAKAMLMRAITPMMLAYTGDTPPWQRIIDPSVMEIDCHGVTFRLICKQKMMTRHGPFGAAEMK